MRRALLESPIIVDSREQTPWLFDGLETRRQKLEQGDYSLLDLEDVVAIERKTLGDYVSSITHGRERFLRELSRMQRDVLYPIIFVEASRQDIEDHLYRNNVHPNAVIGTALSMWCDHGVPVWFAGSRRLAERDAVRLFMNVERKERAGWQREKQSQREFRQPTRSNSGRETSGIQAKQDPLKKPRTCT